jgi:haloalkane dehalogenase
MDRPLLPFESRSLDVSAGRMHYVDEGSGDPVLFVHGTPTWSYDWRHLIAALSAGRRCIAPDLIGFGYSDRPRDFAYTPEAHAKALAEFVARLGLQRFTLVVHDFGGPIALPLALREASPVARLVVLNSWMWSFAGDKFIEQGARAASSPLGGFLYRWANFSLRVITPSAYGDRRKLTPEIHRALLDRFPNRWSRGAVLWTLAKSLMGSSAHYESLWQRRERLRDRPALIVWGLRDSAFRPNQLARWREALPHARVVELPEAGHWPHEEEPGRVAEAVGQFLDGADLAEPA